MRKTVLLARPHPFIVAEMKPFLEHGGFDAVKLGNLAELENRARSSAGVVISLAVSSALGESAQEVFTRLRQAAPEVPVLFAAMLALDKSAPSLERLALHAGIEATIVGVASGHEHAAALGKPQTFLYLSKDDLADAPRRALALRLVQRHFH